MPPRSDVWRAVAIGAALLLSIATIGLHAALIPAGQWQGDEYFNFAMLHQGGVGFFLNRLLTWSPRPVSESVVFLYDQAVRLTHRPLLTPFLATFWLLLLTACIAAGWRQRDRPAGLAVALTVAALFLLGHPVSELFYWPMGVAAYLGCLAGLSFVTLLCVRNGLEHQAGKPLALAAMLLAAGSAEVGVMFVAALSTLFIVIEIVRGQGRAARLAWWVAALAACLPLLWLLIHGRVASPSGAMDAASPVHHRALASLLAAAPQFGRDLLAPDGGAIWLALATKALLFLGMMLASPKTPDKLRLWALAISLAATAYLSIAAAYFQFGTLCCERHASFRQCLFILMVVVLAALAAPWAQKLPGQLSRRAGPALLALSVAIGLPSRLPDLRHDLRAAPAIVAARRDNWQAGFAPGNAMQFRLAPAGHLLHGLEIPPGAFTAAGHPPWYITGILLFFGKSAVNVTPP